MVSCKKKKEEEEATWSVSRPIGSVARLQLRLRPEIQKRSRRYGSEIRLCLPPQLPQLPPRLLPSFFCPAPGQWADAPRANSGQARSEERAFVREQNKIINADALNAPELGCYEDCCCCCCFTSNLQQQSSRFSVPHFLPQAGSRETCREDNRQRWRWNNLT